MLRAYVEAQPTQADLLTVFLEGDGLAWITRYQPSRDPTPRKPVALELAAASAGRPVAYLARPCQDLPDEARRNCAVGYWTGNRFAPEVLRATGTALDELKRRHGARRLRLVGFSGGAAVALLAAAERDAVAGVVTVSGVLDHVAWTEWHGVSRLAGSLNPGDRIAALAAIPQVHLVGRSDDVAPPALARQFADRFPAAAAVAVVEVAGADHACCWGDLWPSLEPAVLRRLGAGRQR